MIPTDQKSKSLRTPTQKWEDLTTKQGLESTTNVQESIIQIKVYSKLL